MTMKSPDTVSVKIAIIASTVLLMGKSAEYSHFIVDDCDTTSMANQSFVIDGLSIPMDDCEFFCTIVYGTNCKSWLWLQSGVRYVRGTRFQIVCQMSLRITYFQERHMLLMERALVRVQKDV